MKGFITTRTRIALVAALLGTVLFVQSQLRVFAEQPLTSRLDISETTEAVSLCDFPLVVEQEGTLMSSLFFDQGTGRVTRITENWQNVHSTITNPANGTSVTFRNAGRDGFTMDEDGNFTSYTQGVRGLITVPGVGAVSGAAGNTTVTVSRDGQVEVSASGFQWDGDFSAVCNYLAGSPEQP